MGSTRQQQHGFRRISQQSLDAVISRADIVDTVQGYTQLQQRGHEFLGRCPFHDERTPSFWVNPAKGVYHCFGCGASGDIIDFVRQKQALDFAEAVEHLADRYRVAIEWEGAKPGDEQRRSTRKRHYDLLDTAAAFYEAYLWKSAAAADARAYLAHRQINEQTARTFRLGFAPEAADGTSKRALARGYSRDELNDVRLLTAKGHDFFRGRLMIPITDRAGRVIGFGGRKLRDEQFGPKYMNSGESQLFHKKETLYTAPDVRIAAREAGSMLVVEGYMDVIALHQAGFANVGAVMGTAVGERQVTELKRLAPRAYFAFDPDTAGEAATMRALTAAQQQELDVRVIVLPEGRDPADVVATGAGAGKLAMQQLVDQAVPLLEYRVTSLLALADLSSGPGRSQAYKAAVELFGSVPEGPERSEQVFRFADRLQLDTALRNRLLSSRPRARESAIHAQQRNRRGASPADARQLRPRPALTMTTAQRIERLFLAVAQRLLHGDQAPAVAAASIDGSHFTLDVHRRAWHQLQAAAAPLVVAHVRDDAELAELAAELTVLSERDGLAEPAHLRELEVRLHERSIDRSIGALREQLASVEQPDTAQLKELARLETERSQLKLQIAQWRAESVVDASAPVVGASDLLPDAIPTQSARDS